jgi:hypothetical protein
MPELVAVRTSLDILAPDLIGNLKRDCIFVNRISIPNIALTLQTYSAPAEHKEILQELNWLFDKEIVFEPPDVVDMGFANETVPGIRFSNTAADPSGHRLESKMTVANDVAPKKYKLIISSPGGSVEKTFEIIQKAPSVLKLIYVDGHQPAANTSNDTDVKIKITGKDLENARILVPAESKGKLELKPDGKVEDGELSQTIRVLKGTPKGTYKLQIRNTNPKLVDVEFVVAAPTPP